MTKNNRMWVFAGVGAVAVAALALWLAENRHQWFRNNFRAIEPGKIYAGGYQFPKPLAGIIDEFHIKTVLCLRAEIDENDDVEQSVLASRGVRFVRIAMPQKVATDDRLAKVDEAVDFLVDPANQPVFVHCWGGKHRAGSVVAVFRLRELGWTKDKAEAELIRFGGTSEGATWPLKVLEAASSRGSAHDDVGGPAAIIGRSRRDDHSF